MDPVTLRIMKPVANPLFPDFERIYQIEFPLYIESMDFDDALGSVDIRISYHRKALFQCSCGIEGLKVHSRLDRIWRALDIARYHCHLHLAVPRLKCPDCGVKTFHVPWARDHSHLTALLEDKILALADYMPHSAVASFLGESDRRILHVLEAYEHPAGAKHPGRGRPRSPAYHLLAKPSKEQGESLSSAFPETAPEAQPDAPAGFPPELPPEFPRDFQPDFQDAVCPENGISAPGADELTPTDG
ncbi:MAG: hypothetical protein LBQ12_11805 [Deltaproteobacteria bacterium]|jgi:hypothetical protein|nr:hypothetical protein [Deltaproteobacteria bacterium]